MLRKRERAFLSTNISCFYLQWKVAYNLWQSGGFLRRNVAQFLKRGLVESDRRASDKAHGAPVGRQSPCPALSAHGLIVVSAREVEGFEE